MKQKVRRQGLLKAKANLGKEYNVFVKDSPIPMKMDMDKFQLDII